MTRQDVVVVGGGAAGLAAAIEAARGGRQVLLVEALDRLGGVLEVSSGQMSAGGTSAQRERGIEDSPELHFQDILRIAGTDIDQGLVRRAVELAPGVIEWLLANGFAMDPACPALYHFHEAYSIPRTYWGVEKGVSVLRVLERLLEPLVAAGSVRVLLSTRCTGLVGDGTGRIEAVELTGPVGCEVVPVGDVVVAAGGHTEDASVLRRVTTTEKVLSGGWVGSDGSIVPVLEAVGGSFWGTGVFTPTYGGIEEPPGSGKVDRRRMPDLVPQSRQPWEVHVDTTGARFVREDVDSVDEREKALAALRPMSFWIVGDARTARDATPLLPSWTDRERSDAWDSHPDFVRSDSVEGLAQACGMDAEVLASTLEAYNRAVQGVATDPFGRKHLPVEITEPPFTAIRNYGSLVKSFAGFRVDERFRVLRSDGPIPNLYAVGEILGGAIMSRDTFVGGMSLTPALAFGRHVGAALAATA